MDLIQGWTHRAGVLQGGGPEDGLVHALDESRLGYPSRALCGVEVYIARVGEDWPPRVYDACRECEGQVAG